MSLLFDDSATRSAPADPAPLLTVAGRAGRNRGRVGFTLATAWLTVVVLAALTASWLPLPDPNVQDYSSLHVGPSVDHILGTDGLGRDIAARLVHGARISLLVGFLAVIVAFVLGGSLGLVAGYYRGVLDSFITGVVDVILAFPALVLAITITVYFGQSLRNITLIIGFLSIPAFTRVSRANTLAYSQREFVAAAKALGARDRLIIVSEIMPNVVVPMVAYGLIAVGIAILVEGALSFLGLGVPARQPSWGGMIASGRRVLDEAPHVSLLPSAAMFLTILSLNFIGDQLRARYDVTREAR